MWQRPITSRVLLRVSLWWAKKIEWRSKHTFSRALGNPSELYAPSIIMGEAWCKMKKGDALPVDLVNTTATSCSEVNETALSGRLSSSASRNSERYQEVMPLLNFDSDQLFETGAEWLNASSVEFDGVNLRAARLSVDLNRDDVPNDSRGCTTARPGLPRRPFFGC